MTPLLMVIGALAGGGGAVLRMLVDTAVGARLGRLASGGRPRRDFSLWGIIVVNISGSFALGLLTALLGSGPSGSAALTVLGAGLLGGYTTFSTASYDTVRLARGGRLGLAFLHAAGQLVACIIAAGIGIELGQAVSRAIPG